MIVRETHCGNCGAQATVLRGGVGQFRITGYRCDSACCNGYTWRPFQKAWERNDAGIDRHYAAQYSHAAGYE